MSFTITTTHGGQQSVAFDVPPIAPRQAGRTALPSITKSVPDNKPDQTTASTVRFLRVSSINGDAIMAANWRENYAP